jgi:hypothetical protein
MRAVPDPSRFKDGDNSFMLSHCWKLMGLGNCIENPDDEGYNSLEEKIPSPVQNTIQAQRHGVFQTTVGFVKLFRVG